MANRSNYDLVGSGHNVLGDRRIMNHIQYGTFVPGAGQVYWLSADLGVPLTPALAGADGGFAIVHAGVVLAGRPSGGGFAVTRTK